MPQFIAIGHFQDLNTPIKKNTVWILIRIKGKTSLLHAQLARLCINMWVGKSHLYLIFPFIWTILCFHFILGMISICHHNLWLSSSNWIHTTPNPKVFQSMCNYKYYPQMGCHKMRIKVKHVFNSWKTCSCVSPQMYS